ncbi:hypothetical protein LCGC14_0788850 [marine sediment metagenome]|uniref:Homing endonuclease LAGLIDADG domain-containing protein n=1 Tax=marine sediment metagenome TaxID=412755 RepID=A0A0F9PXI5_9ZZZZ
MYISLIDLKYAYLAGLIDGEGCIQIKRQKDSAKSFGFYFRLEVQITSTNEKLIAYLISNHDGYIYKQKSANPKHKTALHWRVGSTTAKKLLEKVFPYLIIKREQAQVAYKFQQILDDNPTSGKREAMTKDMLSQRSVLYKKVRGLNQKGVMRIEEFKKAQGEE